MQIIEATCPACAGTVIVDRNLWAVGTIDLRCPSCGEYFAPEGSPGDVSPEDAARSSVPLTIFRPERTSG